MLNAFALMFDDIKEIVMVLRSLLSVALLKMFLEILPHVVLVLSTRGLLVVVLRASDCTIVGNAVLTATNSNWLSLVVLRVRGRHQVIGFITCRCTVTIGSLCCHVKSLARYTNTRSSLVIRINVHTPLKCIVKAHTIGLVLIIGVAELMFELFLVFALLHEENQIWIVRFLDNTREMHRIVYFIFSLKHFFETKVVMAFFEGIERYIFIVLGEYIAFLVIVS